jgi:LysM repeat protein
MKRIKEYMENIKPITFKQSFIVVLILHGLAIAGVMLSSAHKSYAKEDAEFLKSKESQYTGIPTPTPTPTPEPLRKEIQPDGKIATYPTPQETPKEIPKTIPKVNSKYTQTYTIKKGDTIHSISKRFKLNTKRLLQINHITNPNNIKEGQVLKFL